MVASLGSSFAVSSLRHAMTDDAHLIGYTDDVAAIIVVRNVADAKRKVNQVIIKTK